MNEWTVQMRINRSTFATKANFNTLHSKINVALHQAQLSGDGGPGHSIKVNALLPWMAKMADGAAHPGQHLTALNVMICSKQVGKVTIENSSLPTNITKGVKEVDFTL